MADANTNQGIKNSWSLVSFIRLKGRLKIAPFVNKETGESFKSCACVAPDGGVTLVAFSSKMGELSAAEIVAQRDNLQVVQLESGTYKLCRTGESTWEDVDIPLD